jgi:hypothetical protein
MHSPLQQGASLHKTMFRRLRLVPLPYQQHPTALRAHQVLRPLVRLESILNACQCTNSRLQPSNGESAGRTVHCHRDQEVAILRARCQYGMLRQSGTVSLQEQVRPASRLLRQAMHGRLLSMPVNQPLGTRRHARERTCSAQEARCSCLREDAVSRSSYSSKLILAHV